jgi:hypothetical protein
LPQVREHEALAAPALELVQQAPTGVAVNPAGDAGEAVQAAAGAARVFLGKAGRLLREYKVEPQ